MQKVSFIFLNNLLIFFLCHPIFLAQNAEITLETLCKSSSDIVRAKVIDVSSYYSGSNNNRIFSEITFKVITAYKGNLSKGSIFRMKTLGGTVDGITMYAVGTARFLNDEEAILFLTKSGHSNQNFPYKLSSIFKGKYDISEDGKFVKLRNYFEPLKINDKFGSINISKDDYFNLTQFENLINLLSR